MGYRSKNQKYRVDELEGRAFVYPPNDARDESERMQSNHVIYFFMDMN
jgi:hypothetical protein